LFLLGKKGAAALKSNFFSFLKSVGVTRLCAWWNRKQVMILCYHCVTPRPDLIAADPWKMYLGRELFAAQLDYLKENYNVVGLSEYLEARARNRPLPPFSVVLTFDDGKRNFFTVIAPELIKRGMAATTFIVVENTEKSKVENGLENLHEWSPADDDADLSWEEIEVLLKQSAIEIGSHTQTHPVLPELATAEIREELEASFARLAAKTNNRRISLAYPHGRTSDEVMKIAEAVGYGCALTNADAGNDLETPLFALNRTVINSDDELGLFAARLAGVTWRIERLKNFLRPWRDKARHAKKEKLKLTAGVIKNTIF
jgi:peptidoglycan/xylan/chitin deacetylase (PgdA/CDA1 family)